MTDEFEYARFWISTAQFIGHYLGYYLAGIPLLLGIFWVGFDERKQGWHDKLAGTLVVKNLPHADASDNWTG